MWHATRPPFCAQPTYKMTRPCHITSMLYIVYFTSAMLRTIFFLGTLLLIVSIGQAQYFTKTAKSLPRLGRRDGYTVTNPITALFKNGDVDDDGCISADELMAMMSQYAKNTDDDKDFSDKSMEELLHKIQMIMSQRK